MNERTLEILEYSRVRETIAGYCMSEEGKAALLLRVPAIEPDAVIAAKKLSRAWAAALISESPPDFRAWQPAGHFLSRLKVEGASLVLDEFYALAQLSDSVGRMRAWAENRSRSLASGKRDSLSSAEPNSATEPNSADWPLVSRALSLPDLSIPHAEISRIVDTSGELRDLPELKEIKTGIKSIRNDIERLVSRYLSDDTYKNMLQSTLPTIRDGRQVISVRANFRGRIRGIVHEVSQSGQTMYLEPEDVVDRNNDLVAEEHRLSREVARILRELTAKLSPFYEDFSTALDLMVSLDCAGAGARWGAAHRCVFAEDRDPVRDADRSALELRQARHPLLGSKAVPIDLVLTPSGRMVIITGPNTGGKTVSLKTVALFALLNQSGWPVPATEPTVFPVFDSIGCDIGDEQSLDQSLSTFSGHMKNIARILDSATERSLVLLDELGSGTDPQEGSAIAMAVLDRLLEKNALVLVTTHHGILKNYGYTHSACINASVDFDQNTLSPTYRILMGVPGESHALDIAERNGLDPAIVEQARTYLVEERADVSALIRGLTDKHEELSRFEQEKKSEERLLREKRRKTDLKELQLKQKELELREQGFRRMETLLSESRKQLENLVRDIREGELNRDKTLQVKNWIADLGATVDAEYADLLAARSETASLADAYQEEQTSLAAEAARAADADRTASAGKGGRRKASPGASRPNPRTEIVPELAPGVEVYVGPSRRRGTIVRAAKKHSWIVLVDSLRITCAADSLQAVPVSGGERKVTVEIRTDLSGDDRPAFELRLLGMRHDEAVKALERQLDLAAMKGLKEFSVVHGKGHGILQEAVASILKRSPVVKSWAFARPEEGGTGKTLVTLE